MDKEKNLQAGRATSTARVTRMLLRSQTVPVHTPGMVTPAEPPKPPPPPKGMRRGVTAAKNPSRHPPEPVTPVELPKPPPPPKEVSGGKGKAIKKSRARRSDVRNRAMMKAKHHATFHKFPQLHGAAGKARLRQAVASGAGATKLSTKKR